LTYDFWDASRSFLVVVVVVVVVVLVVVVVVVLVARPRRRRLSPSLPRAFDISIVVTYFA
jgi:hypothetical protein